VNQLDEEMSVRLEYFIYSAKKNMTIGTSSNDLPILEGNKENNDNNVKPSPFSIVEVPKTEEKIVQDSMQSNHDDGNIHTSSSASSNGSISSVLFKTPNMKQGRRVLASDLSSTASPLSEKWNEENYVNSLSHAVIPSTIYFNNCLEISMKCLSCHTEFPPKYEYYRDFSLDMDIPSTSSSSSSASPVSSSSSAATTSPSTSTLLTSPVFQSKQKEEEHQQQEISLDLLLDNFFKDDICPWNCSSCGVKDCYVRIRKRIIYLSKYIIIHLKRFHYSMETSLSTKIDRKIKMNLFYNLHKYFKYPSTASASPTPASSSSSGFRSTMMGEAKKEDPSLVFYKKYHELWNSINPLEFVDEVSQNKNDKEKNSIDFLSQLSTLYEQVDVINKEKDLKGCPLVTPSKDYEVTSVIRHLGRDLTSGHYICDIKNPYKKATKYQKDEKDEEIKWIRYNDTIADPVSEVSYNLFSFPICRLSLSFRMSLLVKARTLICLCYKEYNL
jgi:hypothetical protein